VLRACLFSKTCPKILSIDSANEYWNKSGSLNHTDAFGQDLPIEDLAGDVRQYFIASIQHNTVFDAKAAPLRFCQQPENPLYPGPIFRAMSVALDQWVVFGVKPPASVVPQARNGTLVPSQAVRFPAIPATAYAGWPTLPPVQFNPDAVNVNVVADFSNVPPNRRGRATRLWSLKSTGTATTLPAYGSRSCRHPWAHLPAGRCSSRTMAARPPTFASSLVSSFPLPTARPSDWPPAIPASRSRSGIPQAAGMFGPCRRPRHHLCETAYASGRLRPNGRDGIGKRHRTLEDLPIRAAGHALINMVRFANNRLQAQWHQNVFLGGRSIIVLH
jgi:hypothetical protein